MGYEDRDIYVMYRRKSKEGPGPRLMGADTLIGDDVYNHKVKTWAISRKSCWT
jgi:hypothetical protein